jgi:hypothetical protein
LTPLPESDFSVSQEPIKPIKLFDCSRRQCWGHVQKDAILTDEWHTPRTSYNGFDTRCHYCYSNKIVAHLDLVPYTCNPNTTISCDSGLDKNLTKVNYKNFLVSLEIGNTGIPLYLHPDERDKTENGVGIFLASTMSTFKIKIEPNDQTFFGIEKTRYFTVKCKVGNTNITIPGSNNLNPQYHNSTLVLDKYNLQNSNSNSNTNTNTNEFVFYSPSESELQNPQLLNTSIPTANKVYIEITPYVKKSPVKKPQYDENVHAYNFNHANKPMMGNGFMNLITGANFSNSSFASSYQQPQSYFASNLPFLKSSPSQFSLFPPLQMQTGDTYECAGDSVCILLQLICLQPDKEKLVDNICARMTDVLTLNTQINNDLVELDIDKRRLEQYQNQVLNNIRTINDEKLQLKNMLETNYSTYIDVLKHNGVDFSNYLTNPNPIIESVQKVYDDFSQKEKMLLNTN